MTINPPGKRLEAAHGTEHCAAADWKVCEYQQVHPSQQRLVDAFRRWDGARMGAALVELLDLLLEQKHADGVQRLVVGKSVAFLLQALDHPMLSSSFGAGSIGWQFAVSANLPPRGQRKELTELSFTSAPSKKTFRDLPALFDRWRELGFDEAPVRLARSEVQTPRPFGCEPRAAGSHHFEAEVAEALLARLPARARAAILAAACERLVPLYAREGEPSDAPASAVAWLWRESLADRVEPEVAARCLGELEELLQIYREKEDDLMLDTLAAFKYAITAVGNSEAEAEAVVWARRALSAMLEAVASLRYHRDGLEDWRDSEGQWIMRALTALAESPPPVQALFDAIEPKVPIWRVSLEQQR